MRHRLFKFSLLVLAFALGLTPAPRALAQPTILSQPLKKSEVESFLKASFYGALTQFVLTVGSPEQRRLAIDNLAIDGSRKAQIALAEIASAASEPAIRKLALARLLEIRPLSRSALEYVATNSIEGSFRRRASAALKALSPSAREPVTAKISLGAVTDAASVFGLDLSFVQKLTNTEALGEIENGSRFAIQSWFLKKILSLQEAPATERKTRFDQLINEISSYLSREPKIIRLSSPEEFEAYKATLSSRFTDLGDEMRYSKGLMDQQPVRLEVSASMRAEVEKFSEAFRQFDRTVPGFENLFLFDLLSDASAKGQLFRLGLKVLPDREKSEQLNRISSEFLEQSKSLSDVAPRLLKEGVIQFHLPAEQRFFELLISHYFSKYTFAETANVMKAVLERPDRQRPADLFLLMVLHAGPQMQKLLQVVARREGISPELSATFQKLEETGLASPWEKIGTNFKEPPEGTRWVSLGRDARVGTMAEVYKGVVTDGKNEIVIAARSLKSRIRQRTKDEVPRLIALGHAIDTDPLLRRYQFPLVEPVMEDVMSMARAELDIPLTKQNQMDGERVYTANKRLGDGTLIHFVTPKLLASTHPDVMYSTWLKGERFEDFVKRDPAAGLKVAEATARHWIENAFFREMFFHADLHLGNLKIIEIAPGEYVVAFLDFGMVGKLKKTERSLLIRLALAVSKNKDAGLIARYLYSLSEPTENRISLSELSRLAAGYLQTNNGPELTLDIWLGWGLSKGLKLPRNITAFSRGIGAIEQLAWNSGSRVYLSEMVREVAMKHKFELAPDLIRFLSDSVRSRVTQTITRPEPIIEKDSLPLYAHPRSCESLFTN